MYAKDGSNVGVFATKNRKLAELTIDNPLGHIVPELTPRAGEHIIDKTEASAFLGTGFAHWLAMRRVDMLVVAARPPVAACAPPLSMQAATTSAPSWRATASATAR